MRAATTPPHILTLVLLTAASVLSLNMFLPSLPAIAAEFGVTYATASLAVAGYLALMAVLLLILGPLSDRIGRRPVILGALVAFTFASIGAAVTSDIRLFLAFRLAQALIAGGSALSMSIVRDTRPQTEAASLISYIASAMAIGPLIGPMIGGLIDASLGWRAVFWLYTALGAGLLILAWVDLGETRPEGAPRRPLLTALSELIREPLVWAYALCSATSRGVFFIFISGVPFVAVQTFGIGAAQVGLIVGSITGGFMAGAALSGRIARRFQPETMMAAGRVVSIGGMLAGLAFLAVGPVSPITFFACTILAGFGNGLTTPSSSAATMSVRPDLAGSASGFEGALTVGMGALLTYATGLVLTPATAATTLLILMLIFSLAGLGTVFWALRLKAR